MSYVRPPARHHLLLAVTALVLTACGDPPSGPPPQAEGPSQVGVRVLQAQPMRFDAELPGRTVPFEIAEIRPQVTGLIQGRHFEEGGRVKAGQLLYQIDAASYQSAYNSALAALSRSQANLDLAQVKAQRLGELVTIKAVSQQEADDAAAMLKQAQADVAGAKAALESTRIQLAHTRLTSPISGRVGRSFVTSGALVTANQPVSLATVQRLDPMYVDVTQSSSAVLNLRKALANGELRSEGTNAATVKLLLEDGSVYPQEGKLQFSDITVDQSTGMVTLRALFPNPDGMLMPGMYVKAVVEQGVNEHALLVPQQAITRDAKGKPVAHVVDQEDKLQIRPVNTQRAVGDQWVITSGLSVGDRLVVEGQQKARAGDRVSVLDLSGAAAQTAAQASSH